MQQNGFDIVMISSDGKEVKQLIEQESCPHIAIKLTRKITPFTDLVSLFRLVKILHSIKPDIVHSHTPKAGLIAMWAAKIAGVKIRLHTIAGLPWMETKGIKRRMLIGVEKLTTMAATSVFPNSFTQRDFLISNGIAQNKMKVIGNGTSNGINLNHFVRNADIHAKAKNIRQQLGIDENDWLWIFVGRIVKDKGISELIEAFDDIFKLFPRDRLLLVGDQETDLDPLDQKHIDILKNHSAMISCGFQNDIRPYLAASQVLVFPSYREGFPNVPMQAGLMGCALILSDINGCNELVRHNEDGWLVTVKNKASLFNAMLEARNNRTLMQQYANTIQAKIKEKYDQTNFWNSLLNEYRQQLNNKGKIN
jgi:glycosyltransferase involved in cell wall biosynthesis